MAIFKIYCTGLPVRGSSTEERTRCAIFHDLQPVHGTLRNTIFHTACQIQFLTIPEYVAIHFRRRDCWVEEDYQAVQVRASVKPWMAETGDGVMK